MERLLLALAIACLAGCGGTLDDPVDSGSASDASRRDAGQRTDAGTRSDSGVDASIRDAGAMRDAGDAGRPPVDGGVDAGRPDAGQPDAGQPDAGQPDAGTLGPPDTTLSTVVAQSDNLVADGVAQTELLVTILDSSSNPLSGFAVSLAASGTGNTLTQPVGLTDGDGNVSGFLASTVAEVKTVTATVDPSGAALDLVGQPTVTFVPGIPDATGSSVAVSPDTAVADGVASVTITVTVRDASGNPIAGEVVVLAVSGAGNTVTQPGTVSGVNGVVTGSVVSTTAEVKTVTANRRWSHVDRCADRDFHP